MQPGILAIGAARRTRQSMATAPLAHVNSLPPISFGTFQISWSGSDETSGIASYDIEIQVDGASWEVWLSGTTQTSSVFASTVSHSYSFRRTGGRPCRKCRCMEPNYFYTRRQQGLYSRDFTHPLASTHLYNIDNVRNEECRRVNTRLRSWFRYFPRLFQISRKSIHHYIIGKLSGSKETRVIVPLELTGGRTYRFLLGMSVYNLGVSLMWTSYSAFCSLSWFRIPPVNRARGAGWG